MGMNREKYESQVRLICGLKELAGSVNGVYASQKEFFIVTLNEMTADLAELKKENLRETVESFTGKLARGPVSQGDILALKESLDKLVSAKDFDFVCAGMAGSAALIGERLARAQPLCIAAEERHGTLQRDPAADRLVAGAYKHMRFEALEGEAARFRADPAAEDRVLARARERVADYCLVYRLPMSAEDTLPPFSLSSIDAVVAACYRLLARLRGAPRA
jgi:hypothetical protein